MDTNPPIHLWSLEAELHPIVGGNRNVVLRTVGLTRELVFKSTTRAPAALDWLDPVMDAAETAGFIVPRLILSNRGQLSENGWTAEPFLDGQPTEAPRLSNLGPKITRFQKLTDKFPQRPGFVSARDFLLENRGGDIDLTVMPDALATACRAALGALDDRTAIIHSDLTPSNVLTRPDGRIALIDWDEARRDHPAFDLAVCDHVTKVEARAARAWEIACCWKTEPGRARELAEGF